MSGSRTMAQMWQQVDHLKDVIRRQHDKAEKRNAEIKVLEAENAKLRKVMEDLEESDRIHRAMLRNDIELKANLKAENARLREVVSDGEENARLILGESRALRAENARLREELAFLSDCMHEMGVEI